jgi:hypothetical protein
VTLSVPGRASATSSVAASGAFVAITWGASLPGGSADVYCAMSRDSGRTFPAPVRVSGGNGDARLNGEQPPRVTLVPRAGLDPALVIVWTAKGASGTTLLHARSVDGGRTFSRPAVVSGSDAAGNRGWEATTVDARGQVHVAWLDHREHAPRPNVAQTHHEHGDADSNGDGVAMAGKSKLWVGSLDGPIVPRAVTGGVCYCCKTAMAASTDGSLYLAWRHVYPGNIRDIAFTLSRDSGRTFAAPVRVSEDRWVLDGCPENGPALAVDGARVHVVWPTLVSGSPEPALALFYAVTRDGRRFTPRQRLSADGVPRHPQLAIAAGRPVAVWDEQSSGTRRVVLGRMAGDGDAAPVRMVREVVSDAQATYPAIAVPTEGIVVTWTSGSPMASVIRVARR